MRVFTKREEVVSYFIEKGVHKGISKAIMQEYYNFGNYNSNPDYKEEGLLTQINEETDICEAITLNEEEADSLLEHNGCDFEIGKDDDGNECILMDTEPMFDIDGFHL